MRLTSVSAVLVALALPPACAGTPTGDDPRQAQLASFFAQQHLPLAAARPHQLTLRFDEMAKSPFRFLRGTEPLFFRDMRDPALAYAADFDTDPVLVLLQGDAHPENLGVYGREGDQHLELNDFDVAGFGPFHWEVLRASSSLVVALADVGTPSDVRRACARQLVEAYRDTVLDPAAGRAMTVDDVGEVIRRRFDKGIEDGLAREELDEFTVLDGDMRRFKRGNTDPEDLAESLLDVDPMVRDAIPALLEEIRHTLWSDTRPDDFYVVKDVARRCGQGVGSLSAVRVYALLEGPTLAPDDDVVVQFKEATDASLDRLLPYGAFGRDAAERVVVRTRALQSRPDADPLLGHGRLIGIPVVSRTVEDFQKTVRVDSDVQRVSDEPETLARFARDFGTVLAHTHARSVSLGARPARELIETALAGREEEFVSTLTFKSLAYADLVIADHARFLSLREALGPDLGLNPPGPDDRFGDVPPAADPYQLLDPPCP